MVPTSKVAIQPTGLPPCRDLPNLRSAARIVRTGRQPSTIRTELCGSIVSDWQAGNRITRLGVPHTHAGECAVRRKPTTGGDAFSVGTDGAVANIVMGLELDSRIGP